MRFILIFLIHATIIFAQSCPYTYGQIYADTGLSVLPFFLCQTITYTTSGILVVGPGELVSTYLTEAETLPPMLAAVCDVHYETASINFGHLTFSFPAMTLGMDFTISGVTRNDLFVGGLYPGIGPAATPLFATFPHIWGETDAISSTLGFNSFANMCYRNRVVDVFTTVTSFLPPNTVTMTEVITVASTTLSTGSTSTVMLTLQTRFRTETISSIVTTVTNGSTSTLTIESTIISTITEFETRTRETTVTLPTTSVLTISPSTEIITVTDVSTSTLNQGVTISTTLTEVETLCTARVTIPPVNKK